LLDFVVEGVDGVLGVSGLDGVVGVDGVVGSVGVVGAGGVSWTGAFTVTVTSLFIIEVLSVSQSVISPFNVTVYVPAEFVFKEYVLVIVWFVSIFKSAKTILSDIPISRYD